MELRTTRCATVSSQHRHDAAGRGTALSDARHCPRHPLASAVRLRMHGEIKLNGWLPFRAEQVIRTDGSMIWTATVRQHGLPIRGFDRLVDGEGAMRWKLLGVVPVVTASGRDITRSAVGRMMAESVWLASMLCGGTVSMNCSCGRRSVDAGGVRPRFVSRKPRAGSSAYGRFTWRSSERNLLHRRRWGFVDHRRHLMTKRLDTR